MNNYDLIVVGMGPSSVFLAYELIKLGKNKNVLQTYIRLFGEEKYALPQNIEKLDDETKKEIECYIRQSLERMLEHEKELIDKAKALA